MPTPRALLFPGQGAYSPGGLIGLARRFPALTEELDPVDGVASQFGHEPVSDLLLRTDAPSAERLNLDDPPRSHLAIYAYSIAAYQAVVDAFDSSADIVLGHSLGEVAAFTAAGVLSVEDGARAVALRDRAFERRNPFAGGMLALGLSERRTSHLLAALASQAEIAAVNGPQQTVVSGAEADLGIIVSLASAAGFRAVRLRAPYPFHHPMAQTVVDEYAHELKALDFRRMRRRIYSPVVSGYYGEECDLRMAMASSVARPVRFSRAIESLHGEGIGHFIECGARSTLTDLAAQIIPGIHVSAPLRRRAPMRAGDGR